MGFCDDIKALENDIKSYQEEKEQLLENINEYDKYINESKVEDFSDIKTVNELQQNYYSKFEKSSKDVKVVCEECRAGKRGCVACKKQLAKNIIDYLAPIREKRKYYEEHPELVDKILKEGTEKARKVAKETMRDVKKAMKLDYFE